MAGDLAVERAGPEQPGQTGALPAAHAHVVAPGRQPAAVTTVAEQHERVPGLGQADLIRGVLRARVGEPRHLLPAPPLDGHDEVGAHLRGHRGVGDEGDPADRQFEPLSRGRGVAAAQHALRQRAPVPRRDDVRVQHQRRDGCAGGKVVSQHDGAALDPLDRGPERRGRRIEPARDHAPARHERGRNRIELDRAAGQLVRVDGVSDRPRHRREVRVHDAARQQVLRPAVPAHVTGERQPGCAVVRRDLAQPAPRHRRPADQDGEVAGRGLLRALGHERAVRAVERRIDAQRARPGLGHEHEHARVPRQRIVRPRRGERELGRHRPQVVVALLLGDLQLHGGDAALDHAADVRRQAGGDAVELRPVARHGQCARLHVRGGEGDHRDRADPRRRGVHLRDRARQLELPLANALDEAQRRFDTVRDRDDVADREQRARVFAQRHDGPELLRAGLRRSEQLEPVGGCGVHARVSLQEAAQLRVERQPRAIVGVLAGDQPVHVQGTGAQVLEHHRLPADRGGERALHHELAAGERLVAAVEVLRTQPVEFGLDIDVVERFEHQRVAGRRRVRQRQPRRDAPRGLRLERQRRRGRRRWPGLVAERGHEPAHVLPLRGGGEEALVGIRVDVLGQHVRHPRQRPQQLLADLALDRRIVERRPLRQPLARVVTQLLEMGDDVAVDVPEPAQAGPVPACEVGHPPRPPLSRRT
jgi:hypothetical protein